MRVLIVAMANSVHTARWIAQLDGLGWDVHLFPVDDEPTHPALGEVTVHEFLHRARALPLPRGQRVARYAARKWAPRWADRANRLARTIRSLRPDVLHTMEFQHAAYLALDARERMPAVTFPPWLVSNWGSDIYLFGRLARHAERIRAVLRACDYYHCECHRDVALGRDFGFTGEVMPVFPVTGGFDLDQMRSFGQPGPVSARRRIALKGYQGWAGRSLVGLRAIEECADILGDYTVAVYISGPDVKLAAELVSERTGIRFELDTDGWTRDDVLRMHGSARVSIGLSISDAISTSLLETMIMGSFPVQSDTGCGNEWINCGENGLLVPPEWPDSVAAALRHALTDDQLVDHAAEVNARIANERLDFSVIRPQAVEMYERIAAHGRTG